MAGFVPQNHPTKNALDQSGEGGLPPSTEKTEAAARAAIRQAEGILKTVHGEAVMRYWPRPVLDKTINVSALYDMSRDIRVNPAAITPLSSTIHEFGHLLDRQMFGGTEDWGSRIGRCPEVMQTIKASSAYARLQALAKDLSCYHVAYLLRPEELFARAYAQWVSGKAANKTLRENLRAGFASRSKATQARQWSNSDFTEISRAFDKLFGEL